MQFSTVFLAAMTLLFADVITAAPAPVPAPAELMAASCDGGYVFCADTTPFCEDPNDAPGPQIDGCWECCPK